MEPPAEKVNINTIAKTAKVSTTTVSNFINGTEVFPISRETRYRVKRAMLELNYRPHIGGVLMRRNAQRHSKVGFVFGEDCRLPVLGAVNRGLGLAAGVAAGLADVFLLLCVVWALIVITGGNLPALNEQLLGGSIYYQTFSRINPFL